MTSITDPSSALPQIHTCRDPTAHASLTAYSAPAGQTPPATRRDALLAACCHHDHHRARSAWEQLTREGSADALDWVLSGSEQRLLPLLGERAEILGLDDHWRDAIAEATAITWGLNERVLSEIIPVMTAWIDNGIDVLCFKGLGLLGDVYPTQHLRAIGDADVLIRPNQIQQAIDVMEGLGWRIPRGLRVEYRLGRRSFGIGNGTGVAIDLHQYPAYTMPEPRHGLAPAWTDPEVLPIDHPLYDTQLMRPSSVEHALILAANLARPSNARTAHIAADLHLLFSRTPALQTDAAAVTLTRAAQREYLPIRIGAALNRLTGLLGTGIPHSALQMTAPSEAARRAEERARNAELRVELVTATHRLQWLRDSVTVTSVGLGPVDRIRQTIRALATWALVRLR